MRCINLWNITPEDNNLRTKLNVNSFGGLETNMTKVNITQMYFFREFYTERNWGCKSIRIINMLKQTYKITLDSSLGIYQVEMFSTKKDEWTKIFTKYDLPLMFNPLNMGVDPEKRDGDNEDAIKAGFNSIFDDIESIFIEMIANFSSCVYNY